jgi:plastocyanin
MRRLGMRTVRQRPWPLRVGVIVVGSSAMAALVVACSAPSTTTSMAGMPMSAGATSSPTATSGQSPAAVTTEATIHIEGFAFHPPAKVSPGQRISVMNMDGETHSVTADDGHSFAITVPSQQTLTFTAPPKPGRYPFHCMFHAEMHGVLVVQ